MTDPKPRRGGDIVTMQLCKKNDPRHAETDIDRQINLAHSPLHRAMTHRDPSSETDENGAMRDNQEMMSADHLYMNLSADLDELSNGEH